MRNFSDLIKQHENAVELFCMFTNLIFENASFKFKSSVSEKIMREDRF